MISGASHMRQVPMFEEFRNKSKEAFPGRSLNPATEKTAKSSREQMVHRQAHSKE
jgi:hypothetical protein